MSDVNVFIAFGAGVLSFVSPCVIPLYPAFLSYITGMSVEEISKNNKMLNRKSMIHTILFLLGFSSIFIVLGFGTTFRSEERRVGKEGCERGGRGRGAAEEREW